MSEKINTPEERIEASIAYANARQEAEAGETFSDSVDTVNELFNDFMRNEPVPIKKFVPTNGAEQKRLFLSGELRNPNHTYDLLDTLDFNDEIESLERKSRAIIVTQDNLKPVQEEAYRSIADRFVTMTRFMQAAHDYNHADTEEGRATARAEYMRTNIELYGEPDPVVYKSMMRNRLQKIQHMELDENASRIRDELFDLVDIEAFEGEAVELFTPSPETVAWAHDMAVHLYEPLLEKVPDDKEMFSAEEIQQVFQSIFDDAFEGATDSWKVVIREAASINVRTPDKEIIIPPEKTLTLERLKALICHEIGIHALRSIIGEQTDSPQLRVGTAVYYDADEGLGMAVEDALGGAYKEHGEMYYIIASLAHFEGKDFRDTFEIWSRMHALAGAEGKTVDAEYVQKKQAFAYGNVMRVMRGTDELPWFKDLGYYTGSTKIWRYLDEHRGDAEMFQFLIAGGKIDPGNDQDRLLTLEAKSI